MQLAPADRSAQPVVLIFSDRKSKTKSASLERVMDRLTILTRIFFINVTTELLSRAGVPSKYFDSWGVQFAKSWVCNVKARFFHQDRGAVGESRGLAISESKSVATILGRA